MPIQYKPIGSRLLQKVKGSLLPSLAALFAAVPSQAATPRIFDEVGGIVAAEAENFSAREDGTDVDQHKWRIIPTEDAGDGPIANARGGAYIQTLPNSGGNFNSNPANFNAPWVDYIVSINTAGKYRLYTRWNGGVGNNSLFVEIVEVKDGTSGAADWYRYGLNDAIASADDFNRGWDADAAFESVSGEGDDIPALWDLSPGTYTVRYHMREDGDAVDAFILQLNSLAAPGNPGPAESATTTSYVKITTFPKNASATTGGTASFTVAAEGTGTLGYQWQVKAPGTAAFSDIAGATSTSYTTPAATDAMNGAQYQVKVSNGTKTAISPAVSLITDSLPPSLVRAIGGASQTSIALVFSEKLDKTSAETISNYNIPGLGITASRLDAAGTGVTLTTAKQTAGTSYTVTVTGVKDAAGNTMTAAGSGTFTGATLITGKVLVRYYMNIVGTAVANLTSAPSYPNAPDLAVLWDQFSSPEGDNFAENYGAEVIGFYTPPATGNYKFYIRSDDASQLLLSTDDTPGGLRQIAAQGGCCNAFTDAPGTLSSQPIALEKGKPYYFVAYLKEGGGGDLIQVGALGPNDGDINDASLVVPIPADYLSTGFSKTATLSISKDPANVTVQANSPANFSVEYNASSVMGTTATVQWQRAASGSSAFADITGATNKTYTLQFPTAADNGAQFRAQVKIDISDPDLGASTSATSKAATLTVSGDTTPPAVLFVNGGVASIAVGFSEPLDAASATASANYTISGSGKVSSAQVVSAAGQSGVVQVNLTGITPGQSYTVTVTGVKDTAGNTVSSTTKPFDAYHIINSFDDGAVPVGAFVNGTANIQSSGSYNGTGFAELTAAVGSLQGTLVYPETPGVSSVSKFTAKWKMFIGKGSGNPADGLAFVLSSGLDDTTNFGEEGTGSGLIVSFDTYDNGAAEAPAISIKYGGLSEESIDTGGNQVIKTNVPKRTLVTDTWVDVAVQVTDDGKITLIHNNVKYFDNVVIPGWTPIDTPRTAFGGRTGGELEAQWIDDVNILFNADVALAQPPTIAITSPANNATIPTGTPVTITVDAKAPGSTITKVEYFVYGNSIGSSTTAPFSFTIPNPPQGGYDLSASVTSATGATVSSPIIHVVVGNPTKVLFVTTDPGPLSFVGDQAVLQHLVSRGFDVQITTGAAVPDDGSSANGKDIVIQSSSLGSGTTVRADASGSKFLDLTIPVLLWEASNADDMKFQEVNGDAPAGFTQINIVDASTPLTAGLPAGLLTVVSSAQTFSQATPVGAHIVAQNPTDPTKATLFYYEKGDKGFNDFVMPGRRAFFFFQDNTASAATADAWKIFDATTDWLLGKGGTSGDPTASISRSGTSVTVSSTDGGTVQSKDSLGASTWIDVGPAPQTIQITTGSKFFRIKK